MEIKEIRIKKFTKTEGPFKAVASVNFDDEFVVHDIKVLERADGELFVGFPSKQVKGEFKNIAHPISGEAREKIVSAVIAAYNEE